MKHLIFIGMLLIISISCYAQEAQESYTVLMLEFEDRTGLENPLLAAFNDTIDFVLSRQAGPVQVRVMPKSHRDALLARAAAMHPDKAPLEHGLLVAEWVDADALTRGSYTKQGEQWSLEAEVYHRREDRKARQEIQIQGDNVYKLLDGFPAHLLQQFTDASYIALTTDSWKAYEEFRKGLQQLEYYNFFGALEHYDKALELDPTLALAYAEQNHIYALRGQSKQATEAIQEAQKWMSKASPMEQLAIRALAYAWDPEKNAYRDWLGVWDLYGVKHLPPTITTAGRSLAPGGVWDEPLLHQLIALASIQGGKRAEADQHHQQWFKAIQQKIQAHPQDQSLLYNTADYCLSTRQYVDEAIGMALKAIELEPEAEWREEGYVLMKLYELKGDTEQSVEQAKRIIQHLPAEPVSRVDPWPPLVHGGYFFAWDHLATFMNEGKISPERLLRWCKDVLNTPSLPQASRVRTQYLIAEIHHAMNDNAKMEATLTAIGAPREKDWMVMGPLEASEADLFPETPPFAALFTNLARTHVGVMGKQMQWEPWEDQQPLDGLVNIWWVSNVKYYDEIPYAHHQPPAIIYSCIYVNVPAAAEAQVRAGFGPMRIWLNENPSPVVEVSGIVAPAPDKVVKDISLAAGLNRFLVGIVSGNTYGFYFRITDPGGNPIPGLEFVSAKEALVSR